MGLSGHQTWVSILAPLRLESHCTRPAGANAFNASTFVFRLAVDTFHFILFRHTTTSTIHAVAFHVGVLKQLLEYYGWMDKDS